MADSSEALDIDLYQARMLIAFHRAGMDKKIGTMEAFVRSLPPNRKFLVACGLVRIVEYLQTLKITAKDVRVFKQVLPDIEFDEALGNYLTSIDFTKLHVRAMREGDIAFANEPLISVSGPVGVAQFIEKKVLSILNHDVRIASKAARIALAARGKPVAEFGGRRGADKMSAEIGRAAFIGGFSSTSNVLCFQRYGVPCIGTMGHVWVMAHDEEAQAYSEWSKQFPNSTYLPDTYNVYGGVEKILKDGSVGGIRFDSGDILENSIQVRRELNKRGYTRTLLGATNDLNEYKIAELLNAGAPLDWFGVGTEVVSTPDAPSCSFIYKLVELEDPDTHVRKLVAKIAANGKGTLPGAKQVFRFKATPKVSMTTLGCKEYTHDVLALESEVIKQNCEKRLMDVFLDCPLPSASISKELCQKELARMPHNLQTIDEGFAYPVVISDGLLEANAKFLQENSHKTVWGRNK